MDRSPRRVESKSRGFVEVNDRFLAMRLVTMYGTIQTSAINLKRVDSRSDLHSGVLLAALA